MKTLAILRITTSKSNRIKQQKYEREAFHLTKLLSSLNHRLNNLDHAYALIEVNPKSSKQEVKKAYRRLISRNHPDKLIAQGLPEEMIKIANEKTQKIMKAYELICKTKGW